MTTSDWITLGAAILVSGGTLFLGIMAWRTIRQARSIQKAEKRERLLNEIIEWAIDVCRCGLKPSSIPTSGMAKSKAGSELYMSNILGDLLLEYESISGRTEYIRRIALTFGENLKNTADSLSEIIKGRIKLLEKQMDILAGKTKNISDIAELAKTDEVKEWIETQDWPKGLNNSFKVIMFTIMMNRTILLDNAKQVIEEATKIKTKDIS